MNRNPLYEENSRRKDQWTWHPVWHYKKSNTHITVVPKGEAKEKQAEKYMEVMAQIRENEQTNYRSKKPNEHKEKEKSWKQTEKNDTFYRGKQEYVWWLTFHQKQWKS